VTAWWLLGTGLISLSENPVPVEEQPVAKITIAESATASNPARSMRFTETQEQWSGSKLPLREGHAFLIKYLFIFIRVLKLCYTYYTTQYRIQSLWR
jgi:hypothetical protein